MEDIINQIDGQVQIIFERSYEGRIFRDALWMTQSEYDAITPEEIQAQQQKRFDNWVIVITPTPEETPV